MGYGSTSVSNQPQYLNPSQIFVDATSTHEERNSPGLTPAGCFPASVPAGTCPQHDDGPHPIIGNLLGARTTSLRTFVTQVPPPLAAEMLGYSYSVAHRYAELAAQPWMQYSAQRK